jgi:hypothetical protein
LSLSDRYSNSNAKAKASAKAKAKEKETQSQVQAQVNSIFNCRRLSWLLIQGLKGRNS